MEEDEDGEGKMVKDGESSFVGRKLGYVDKLVGYDGMEEVDGVVGEVGVW